MARDVPEGFVDPYAGLGDAYLATRGNPDDEDARDAYRELCQGESRTMAVRLQAFYAACFVDEAMNRSLAEALTVAFGEHLWAFDRQVQAGAASSEATRAMVLAMREMTAATSSLSDGPMDDPRGDL